MLTKKNIPKFITLICCVEIIVYLWSQWTSTFGVQNFFSIEIAFIYDKSARIAARISSMILLASLLMVAYYGLQKIYAFEKLREKFLTLLTIFSVNHCIHFIFVWLLFNHHGISFDFNGPIAFGGVLHGFITFMSIVIVPIILWRFKTLNKFIYFAIIVHLFNTTGFVVKTFLGKVKPPEIPAYHNQFGVFVFTIVCLYILYGIYFEHK